MTRPQKFIIRMTVFCLAVIAVAAVLSKALVAAFMANPALNGVILLMLIVGAVYAWRRVLDLAPEIGWITAFRRVQNAGSVPAAPRLMAPAAQLLATQAEGGMRLSPLSMRSVLDGIASRLEESREISRYFTGLLIFLGLLGTFWGLLGTIGAIGSTISGLTVDGTDMALMFDELKAGLEAPLSGMGTAFSSSLFGLTGSLVLGFLDLQASQAQTRFYNEVEDWLASVTHLSRGGDAVEGVAMGGGGAPDAYMTALMEQSAAGIEKLARTIREESAFRHEAHAAMSAVAEHLATLADRLDAQRAQTQAEASARDETSRALARAIEGLGTRMADASNAGALDEATRQHIRNLDVGIKRLIEEQSRAAETLNEGLRGEIRLLARTLSAGLGEREGTAPASPAAGNEQPRARPLVAEREKDDN